MSSNAKNAALEALSDADIGRDRDQFLRELIGELSSTLEDVIGLEEASGFIAVVGARLGAVMDAEYREALGQEQLDIDHVAAAMVDLKRRIKGGFSIESLDEDKIVLVNDRCPFGKYVEGRSSLCMMTSNVFGKIAADNLGYARLEIDEAIAKGDSGCRVIVHLRPTGDSYKDEGREYFAVSGV